MFEAAARHLNFRLAAEELNLTQGAVAQSVRGLEKDLGIKLFKRMPRGLALTIPAKAYYSEVARGLAIIEQATSSLQPNTNLITISVPPSFASKWLVPRLPGFAEAHPGLEVGIYASETVTDLAAQDVDVAVRQGLRPIDLSLDVHHLASRDLCALCSPDVKFSTKQVNCLAELSHLPLIQDSHRYWQSLLPDVDVKGPAQFLQFNQTALALDAAANGQGIAIAPMLIAINDLALNRLVKIWQDPKPSDHGFWLVHPRSGSVNEAARASLVDWLLHEANQSNTSG